MDPRTGFIRTRLAVMMFLEFFLWASWYVPIGGYMNSTLEFTGVQIGWIYATTALGAMISPLFVGYVADRLFSTERVLGVLHLLGGLCLFLAAGQETFKPMMVLLIVNALCFMPTLALVNTVVFRNIDDPDKFSRVAVWGTIGWIVSGLIVGFILGDATRWFFYLAGGGALAMGLYSFTLPHTPPKGAEEAGGDVLGLRAIGLLKEPSFLVFTVSVLLISIPLTFYFTWANAFLIETDRPKPTALMTLCQFSEIVVMIVMPWFIGRIGLKNVLVIGMAAWVVRYVCFASLLFPLVIVGLLVHGFCYCFVFVASFIYADKKAPREMSASAQSFIAFLMWGVGMFLGTQLAGFTGEQYPPQTVAAVQRTAEGEKGVPDAPLPDWAAMPTEEADTIRPSDVPDDGLEVQKDTAGMVAEITAYAKEDLLDALQTADTDGDSAVTYAEWRLAQAHQWPAIWLWPGALAALVCIIFALGGRDAAVKADEQETAEQPNDDSNVARDTRPPEEVPPTDQAEGD